MEGEAIRHFDIALSLTIAKVGASIGDSAHTEVVLARMRLAKGDCLQALGLPEDAKREMTLAVEIAEQLGQVLLLARTSHAADGLSVVRAGSSRVGARAKCGGTGRTEWRTETGVVGALVRCRAGCTDDAHERPRDASPRSYATGPAS